MEALTSKAAAQSPQPSPPVEARADAPEAPAPGPLRPASGDASRRAAERRRRLVRGFRQAVVAAAVALALRPRPVPVDVATAARGALVVAIEETGVARVKDRYVVSAPMSGS